MESISSDTITYSTIAIGITTHNRCDDLRLTLTALRTLNPAPAELVVCADGCTDATESMLREEFPECRVMTHQPGQGSIASRDRMIRESTAPFFLFLDDDSHPVESDFLEKSERLFLNDPDLAVVTFPQRSDEFPETLTQKDFGDSCYVASYVDSGAVLRRSHYLSSAGYPTLFFHAYEEPDYALQCIAAGRKVLLYTELTVRHRYTLQTRSEKRTHLFHARNEFWSVWLRCPFPYVLPVALFRVIRQLGYAMKRGWVFSEPRWWIRAISGFLEILRQRRPLSWQSYRQWMRLMRMPEKVKGQRGSDAVENVPSGNRTHI